MTLAPEHLDAIDHVLADAAGAAAAARCSHTPNDSVRHPRSPPRKT
jgi:hypothetical protein